MNANTSDTRQVILDAAERLFAEKGFEGTSLRELTTAAGVNIAAVNYHFGSKDALIESVFRRRIQPINARRLEGLSRLHEDGASPTLEAILDVFLRPALDTLSSEGGRHFAALMGRIYSEPDERKLKLSKNFEETMAAFVEAIGHALPDLPRSEVLWRFFYAIGCMSFPFVAGKLIQLRSGGLCDLSDLDANRERLVAFIAAGFRASAEPEESHG